MQLASLQHLICRCVGHRLIARRSIRNEPTTMSLATTSPHSCGNGNDTKVLLYKYPQLVLGTLHSRYAAATAALLHQHSNDAGPYLPAQLNAPGPAKDIVFVDSSSSSNSNSSTLTTAAAAAENSVDPAVTGAAPAAAASDSSIRLAALQPPKRRRRAANLTSTEVQAAAAAVPATDADAIAGGARAVLSANTADASTAAVTVVHCPNTGSMKGLLDILPAPAACSESTVATRKYKHTLEMIRIPSSSSSSSGGAQYTWVGVHSALANKLVKEMLIQRLLPQLGQYDTVQPEIKLGTSRFDFLLTRPNRMKVYVEVKSITMAMPISQWSSLASTAADGGGRGDRGDMAATSKAVLKGNGRNRQQQAAANAAAPPPAAPVAAVAAAAAAEISGASLPANGLIALFPDAVSERAQRHVLELTQLAGTGHEAVCIFAIQRSDCSCFAAAAHIDAAYAAALAAATAAGVQMIAVVCELEPATGSIWYGGSVPVLC